MTNPLHSLTDKLIDNQMKRWSSLLEFADQVRRDREEEGDARGGPMTDGRKIVELFGHLDQTTVPLSDGPQLSKAAIERLRKIEQLDLQALLAACHFPVGAPVTYYDEEGGHDPCYVVLPGGAMLSLNHWGDELTDVARAVFIVRSCNAALAIADRNPQGGDVQQAPSRSDESGGANGNRSNTVTSSITPQGDAA